jgi:hypothetical protein
MSAACCCWHAHVTCHLQPQFCWTSQLAVEDTIYLAACRWVPANPDSSQLYRLGSCHLAAWVHASHTHSVAPTPCSIRLRLTGAFVLLRRQTCNVCAPPPPSCSVSAPKPMQHTTLCDLRYANAACWCWVPILLTPNAHMLRKMCIGCWLLRHIDVRRARS